MRCFGGKLKPHIWFDRTEFVFQCRWWFSFYICLACSGLCRQMFCGASSRTHKQSRSGVTLRSTQQTNLVVLLLLCITGAALPPLKLGHSFCAMKADDGPCKAIHIRYFFNIKSRKCEEFEYGGCHGNENNFQTLEECQKKCVVTGQYPFSYPPTNSSFASVTSHSETTWIWAVETLFCSY